MKQIKYVDLHEIKELLPITLSEQAVSLKQAELLVDKSLNVKIHLGQDSTTGDLWLIRGTEELRAYTKINSNQAVPCVVHKETNIGKCWLIFLCYLINTSSTVAIDIHHCVIKVFSAFENNEAYVYRFIEMHCDMTYEKLNTYLFHPDVPDHLKTEENKPRIVLLNKIQTLKEYGISKVVRDQLTYFALESFPSQLTEDKLEAVKWLIVETDGYKDLPQGQQIYLLAFAMEYKKYLLHHFQKMIDDFYDRQYEEFISDLKKSDSQT